MRTLFIGSTKRGYLALKALVQAGAELSGIISLRQEAHEAERFEEPIRDLAEMLGVPCFETHLMTDRDYAALIREVIRPEIAFVVGCRILLPKEIYEIPPHGTFALHDSLLPQYRGFAPLNWSIMNGEDHTGVTLFRIDETTDGGDIVAQKRVPIGPDDTAPVVYERICQATVDLVLDTFPRMCRGDVPCIPQNPRDGSHACTRTPADGVIEWNRPTNEIYNQVRALTHPYPGAFTYLKGRKLWVWSARPAKDQPVFKGRIPGRVVSVSRGRGSVDVLTGDGALTLLEVQLEGEERSAAASVIRSVRTTLGLHAEDLLERIRTLERRSCELAV